MVSDRASSQAVFTAKFAALPAQVSLYFLCLLPQVFCSHDCSALLSIKSFIEEWGEKLSKQTDS